MLHSTENKQTTTTYTVDKSQKKKKPTKNTKIQQQKNQKPETSVEWKKPDTKENMQYNSFM